MQSQDNEKDFQGLYPNKYFATTHFSQEGARRTQAGLSLHFNEPQLALTSSAIDRTFARLERKLASMQKFRTDESGRATLNAWGIVHDFRRFGSGTKREGKSPAELAGVKLEDVPWLQFVLIKLSKVSWLKPAS